MKKLLILVLWAFLGAFQASPALAVEPDEMLKDPALEARAREISAELRCLVCQNQSIDDSNAELAKDLRVLVRERITAGDSNSEVIDYLVGRYGEFVLLNPRFGTHTLILWLTAPLIFGIGIFALILAYRRNKRRTAAVETTPSAALSDEEKQALDKVLKDD